MEMLADINYDTVDFIPNYDETRNEPVVLPSKFPNLLVNGAGGIAVCVWLATTHRALDDQYGALQGNVQIAAALLVLACVIEMARRAIGWPLPLIAPRLTITSTIKTDMR